MMTGRLPERPTEQDYRLTLMVGYVMALIVLIVAVNVHMPQSHPQEIDLAVQEVITMEEIIQTEQIEKLPPPPRPPVPVEVPDDAVLDDIELDLDVTLDLEIAMELPPPPPPPPVEEVEEDEIEIFVVAEKMPEIIGGLTALYNAVPYPEIARKAGIEGQVVLRTTITREGIPTDIEVVRSAGALLDKAAIEGLSAVRFNPGLQRGKPVMVRMNIPIRFRLRD